MSAQLGVAADLAHIVPELCTSATPGDRVFQSTLQPFKLGATSYEERVRFVPRDV